MLNPIVGEIFLDIETNIMVYYTGTEFIPINNPVLNVQEHEHETVIVQEYENSKERLLDLN